MKFLILSCVFLLCLGDKEADRVYKLPGNNLPNPDFKMYSGYLPIEDGNGKQIHYFFVTTKSQDPTKDPLTLWLNGGPGCSSMEGALMENGPYRVDEVDSKIYVNEYAWNNASNMLYFESPAGVGYSILGDPSNKNTNDNITASDNLKALLAWFKRFPEYNTTSFYITGESYAGIYVPTLAYQIQYHNNYTKNNDIINLEGIMVGNGVVDWNVDADSAWPYFLWWHGLIPYEVWTLWDEYKCKTLDLITEKNPDPHCLNAYNRMLYLFTGVNYYDIYKECYWTSSRDTHKVKFTNSLGGISNCLPDTGLTDYMNQPGVRSALNINSSLGPWNECTNAINYTIDYNLGSYYTYPVLINSGIKIRIYSGDTDSAVPTCGTRQWIKRLQDNKNLNINSNWKEWHMDNQVVGFYETYNQGNFTFMTIKGTGHMSIQWKRPEGFHMFETFLNGNKDP